MYIYYIYEITIMQKKGMERIVGSAIKRIDRSLKIK